MTMTLNLYLVLLKVIESEIFNQFLTYFAAKCVGSFYFGKID